MKIDIILKEFFYVLTGALLIFIILEIVWPGVVLAYLNLNLLLIFWLVNGIVIIILDKKYNTNKIL